MDFISEYKHVGEKTVHKYNIIGTNLVVYNAWEPSSVMGKHSSITFIDSKCYGQIGHRHMPPEIDALPAGSQQRIDEVHKNYEEQYQEAYRIIIEAFPEAAAGNQDMGDIEIIHRGT